MNRNNFLPHVALALVLILVAAFAGQVRNWQRHWHLKKHVLVTVPLDNSAPRQAVQPKVENTEVFVRFRAGVSEEKIRNITERLHDSIEDQTEAVTGLNLIEDEDGKNAETVIAEYSALPEVEYAEKIYKIQLDEAGGSSKPVLPNDPRFSEQWALANDGQNGGTRGRGHQRPGSLGDDYRHQQSSRGRAR